MKSQLARPGRIQVAPRSAGSVGGLRFSSSVDSTILPGLLGPTTITTRQGEAKGSVVLTGSRWSRGKLTDSTFPCRR